MDCRLGLLEPQCRILWLVLCFHPVCNSSLIPSTTGGDDLKMKGWDIRQGGSQAIFTNKRLVDRNGRTKLL